MSTDEKLQELLDRWESLREQGLPADPEQLCSDCPELLEGFRRKLQLLGLMDWMTQPIQDVNDADPVEACGFGLSAGVEPVPGYHLLTRLGKGGFGEVWKATAPGGVEVALKFIPLEDRADIEVRALEVIKNIRHAHLLGMSGYWQREGWLIVAMELADGTLLDRLDEAQKQGKPGIPREDLIPFLHDAAEGIDHLNSLDIQHRDIKPQNLLLVGGCVKVGDFGLARLLERTVVSHSGSMTVPYAAPEFFEGETSSRSDQYSLAVTYCQLCGGHLPFEGNHAQVMHGHLHGQPDLSMLLEVERGVVARALSKNPADRWPSCAAFVGGVPLPLSN